MTNRNKEFSEKAKEIRVFQAKILERFLTKEQMDTLKNGYMTNRVSLTRESRLERPILMIEKKMLKDYFDSVSTSVIASRYGSSRFTAGNKIGSIALRVLFQNREKLNLDEVLSIEGGEEA